MLFLSSLLSPKMQERNIESNLSKFVASSTLNELISAELFESQNGISVCIVLYVLFHGVRLWKESFNFFKLTRNFFLTSL